MASGELHSKKKTLLPASPANKGGFSGLTYLDRELPQQIWTDPGLFWAFGPEQGFFFDREVFLDLTPLIHLIQNIMSNGRISAF